MNGEKTYRPKIIITVDVDGKRAFGFYLRVQKDISLEEGLPWVVDFLRENQLEATFFVVGQNVRDFPRLHRKLMDFEIGNHTFTHPSHFTTKTTKEKEEEIIRTHSLIQEILETTPRMFRAPDYQIDKEVIGILKRSGYRGDSSLIKVLYPWRYFMNYLHQKSLNRDDFEFPLSSFLLPFNGTSMILYGTHVSKSIFHCLTLRENPVIINFHPRDFVNEGIKQPGFWRRNKSLNTSMKMLEYIKNKADIISFRQFLTQTGVKKRNEYSGSYLS